MSKLYQSSVSAEYIGRHSKIFCLCCSAPEELHSFSRVFHTSLANNMAERHMWLSIVNRPDHSRFTRVQRATCCVTLVYSYMFINAMWYGLIKDQSDAAGSISWSRIGWEEVIIALVSAAAIFPVALVLICIFKRSRSKVGIADTALTAECVCVCVCVKLTLLRQDNLCLALPSVLCKP